MVILGKDPEKPEVVCAILWAFKRQNILGIFTDMQCEILQSLKSVAKLMWEGKVVKLM